MGYGGKPIYSGVATNAALFISSIANLHAISGPNIAAYDNPGDYIIDVLGINSTEDELSRDDGHDMGNVSDKDGVISGSKEKKKHSDQLSNCFLTSELHETMISNIKKNIVIGQSKKCFPQPQGVAKDDNKSSTHPYRVEAPHSSPFLSTFLSSHLLASHSYCSVSQCTPGDTLCFLDDSTSLDISVDRNSLKYTSEVSNMDSQENKDEENSIELNQIGEDEDRTKSSWSRSNNNDSSSRNQLNDHSTYSMRSTKDSSSIIKKRVGSTNELYSPLPPLLTVLMTDLSLHRSGWFQRLFLQVWILYARKITVSK